MGKRSFVGSSDYEEAHAAQRIRNAEAWRCPACSNWNTAGDEICRWCGEIPSDWGPRSAADIADDKDTFHTFFLMPFLMIGGPIISSSVLLLRAFPRFVTGLNVLIFLIDLYQIRYNFKLFKILKRKTRFWLVRRQIYVLWCLGWSFYAIYTCLLYWLHH